MRSSWAEFEQNRVTMEELRRVLVTVQEKLRLAEVEIISLKRSAGPEDLTPAAKRSCIDAAVQRMLEVQQEKKVAGLEVEVKNMVMHKSREELGLHPDTKH